MFKKDVNLTISKVTKNQRFALSLEDTYFKKTLGAGVDTDPPSPDVSGFKRGT